MTLAPRIANPQPLCLFDRAPSKSVEIKQAISETVAGPHAAPPPELILMVTVHSWIAKYEQTN